MTANPTLQETLVHNSIADRLPNLRDEKYATIEIKVSIDPESVSLKWCVRMEGFCLDLVSRIGGCLALSFSFMLRAIQFARALSSGSFALNLPMVYALTFGAFKKMGALTQAQDGRYLLGACSQVRSIHP